MLAAVHCCLPGLRHDKGFARVMAECYGECYEGFTAGLHHGIAMRGQAADEEASHAEQLRLRASQQASRGSAANIATKSTVKAQNTASWHGVVSTSNDAPAKGKTRTWLPDGRYLHLNTAERDSEGVGVGDRQAATLALPRHRRTERSTANAPSGNEKETPCVAAAGRVAISVNSLVARRECAGYRGPVMRCARHGGRRCWHACSLGRSYA